MVFAGFDGPHLLFLFGISILAAAALGTGFTLALMAAWLMHEAGRVAGYRIAGHETVRFRLVPRPGLTISDEAPRSDGEALFLALCGPAASLAPMIFAYALGQEVLAAQPELARAAQLFALATGALNFVLLLPVMPFAGGQVFAILMRAGLPRLGTLPVVAAAAFLLGMSLTMQSLLLFLAAIVGGLAVLTRPETQPGRIPLPRRQIHVALTAYFATISAFFTTGVWVLTLIPLPGF